MEILTHKRRHECKTSRDIVFCIGSYKQSRSTGRTKVYPDYHGDPDWQRRVRILIIKICVHWSTIHIFGSILLLLKKAPHIASHCLHHVTPDFQKKCS